MYRVPNGARRSKRSSRTEEAGRDPPSPGCCVASSSWTAQSQPVRVFLGHPDPGTAATELGLAGQPLMYYASLEGWVAGLP